MRSVDRDAAKASYLCRLLVKTRLRDPIKTIARMIAQAVWACANVLVIELIAEFMAEWNNFRLIEQ